MRLEDMLKNVSGITNRVIKENCWEGQFNVLEGIQVLQSKINEIISAINNGIIKGDKGDTPNVQVGETTTLEPGNNASVTQTGDMLNPIFNFSIPKGDKGDKGDTGKASESIQDNVVGLDTCWSSQKTVGYVDNMFNSLQDVKGVNYATDKDYFVASGSKNGVVKDLKISGRSLVNLSEINKRNVNYGGMILKTTKNLFKPNTEYTQIINIKSNTLSPSNEINNVGVINESSTGVLFPQVVIQKGFTGTIIRKATTTSNMDSIVNISSIRSYGITVSGVMEVEEIILEGDFTQNPPQYFGGIASVGNGTEIEVLSRKEDGNLFNGLTEKGALSSTNGTETTSETQKRNLGFIKVEPNLNYKLVFVTKDLLPNGKKPCMVVLYDNNYNFIKAIYDEVDASKFFTTSNCAYIRFRVPNDATNIVFSKFSSSIVDFKQDKKPILFKDTDGAWKPVTELRGIDTNSCDILDSTVNKLYKKYDKIILNGSENIVTFGTIGSNDTISFAINDIVDSTQNPNKANGNFISDRLPYKDIYANNVNVEGMNIHLKSIRISVMKSKLETQDVTGFKKWLQNNPITIIYQLSQEKVYEVNPLDLQSFENETMILFKYGVVNGTSEFYIDSNLGSITLENMKRLSRIENEIYQVKKIVLNGDYRTMAQSTYPEDFKEVVKYE